MVVPTDPITHRKLALTKQLYEHAVVQASHHVVGSRVLAVIAFDLASETLLRALVTGLDPTRTPADGFSGLLQQAEDQLSSHSLPQLPDRGNIRHVHAIRNDAQHKGRYPGESEVDDSRIYTRDFLTKTAELVWGIRFESVSLVDLIQDAKLKEFLTAAEAALAKSDLRSASQQSAAAVSWAFSHVRGAIVGRLPSFVKGLVAIDTFGKPASEWDSEQLFRSLERLQETVMAIALGLNYADYVRFRDLAGDVVFAMSEHPHFLGGKEVLSSAEAELIVGFAVDTVWRIESRVGDIQRPFRV